LSETFSGSQMAHPNHQIESVGHGLALGQTVGIAGAGVAGIDQFARWIEIAQHQRTEADTPAAGISEADDN
jgi:hypothetical protein